MRPADDSFDETLTAPVSWCLLGALFVAAVTWAFFVATPLVATLAATIVAAGSVGTVLYRYGNVRVATDPDGFCAGRALLPYRHTGEVAALNAESTRRLLGVEADARAYLLIRPYCKTAVKVIVDDPADPTPYWLVSSRHPEALASSLSSRVVRD